MLPARLRFCLLAVGVLAATVAATVVAAGQVAAATAAAAAEHRRATGARFAAAGRVAGPGARPPLPAAHTRPRALLGPCGRRGRSCLFVRRAAGAWRACFVPTPARSRPSCSRHAAPRPPLTHVRSTTTPRPPMPRRPRARPRPRRRCAASALTGESRRRCSASPALPAPPEPALRGLWRPRGPRRAGGLSGAPLRRARPRGAEEGCRLPRRPRRRCPAPGPPPPVPWRSSRALARLEVAVRGPAAAVGRFGASHTYAPVS